MQMSQPTQMASDHDIMITNTYMHKHTHQVSRKCTHTKMSSFLKEKTKCLTDRRGKVETERLFSC